MLRRLEDLILAMACRLPGNLGDKVCRETVGELCRFGMVGVGATLTHAVTYSAFVELAGGT